MPGRILIVDDDPDVVLFLVTLLQDNGYQTEEAADGREGLQKARAKAPDLILLDLMMPHKSGLALLTDLKSDRTLKHVPVVMVSGVTGETGIDLQAFFNVKSSPSMPEAPPRPDGFLQKPVDPQQLLDLVRKLLPAP